MKAILRFQDGRVRISQAPSSEDIHGNIYLLDELEWATEDGEITCFSFFEVVERNGSYVAEYRERIERVARLEQPVA